LATERNPFEKTMDNPVAENNVVALSTDEESSEAKFEYNSDDGSVIVDFSTELGDNPSISYSDPEGFYKNLVSDLDEDDLEDVSNQVINSYEADLESRAEWEDMFSSGLDLLGLKLEETNEPFEGACTAVHPLLIESAVSFQSKASSELFPAGGPVKAQVMGKATPEKQDQANRVQEYMNYQLTELMPEYFDELERMLFHLPLFGSSFKKMYYDTGLDRPVSEFVPIDQFVVSNFAVNLRSADRYTQVLYRSPIQLEREIAGGMYEASDQLLENPELPNLSTLRTKMNSVTGVSPSSTDFDGQYTLLEQHCYLDIESLEDETELTLPYIVTIDQDSRAVLSIRRNYDPDDPQRKKKLFFTHYRFVPALGFYGIGYIHMLGNLTASATSALRSLLDAGQFANLPAGFRAKGVRITGENDPIAPGEFKEVEATGMDLSKSIVPLPYKEPSQTLYQMLNFVTAAGQKFADNTEQVINDSAGYGPVGTTMALLEASSKFFSAVHKRLHHAQREELKILARINYESMPKNYPFTMAGDEMQILRTDFDGRIDIIPVSDPNVPSSAHRMMMAQMALQMAQQAPPGMYNTEELHRTILKAAHIPNLDLIIPTKPQPQPLDPVSDILAASKGMAIRAFSGQDHEAHVKVKMAYMQDPENGANPIMQRIVPILAANIQEHSVMKYQEQMNGVTQQMIQGQENVSPQVIEQAMTQAAQQVLVANQQAAKKPPTPEEQMVMMEGRRLDLEERKLQAQMAKESTQSMLKDRQLQSQMAKENAESMLKNRELDLKERELALEAYVEGATNLMKINENDKDRQLKQAQEALKMLSDLAKQDQTINLQKGMAVFKKIENELKQNKNINLQKGMAVFNTVNDEMKDARKLIMTNPKGE
tara:strand:- start:330 stop:2975 length:2646 start_codon:yes stop_codon:yes gene_type:complete